MHQILSCHRQVRLNSNGGPQSLNEPLVFLAARTLLQQDVCDYPHKRKRLYMTGPEEALVDFSEIMK
ncbi:MAG: hypothetical protein CFE43_21555 [Burkholderiales bacterium PBB3]|nr:MAG: hypothetical protein CFE43_21555 [Burkholderiales bacterium PBB3]